MKRLLSIVIVLALLLALAIPALADDEAVNSVTYSDGDDEGEVVDTTVTDSGSSSTSSDQATSPQTGYNTVAWTAAIVVLLLGAGYCFVNARKKMEG